MDNTVGSPQHDIILGTLLGDGFLEKNGKNFRLVIDHSLNQISYVKWLKSQLQDFKSSVVIKKRFDSRVGKTYNHCILRTESSRLLDNYSEIVYRGKSKKMIPKNLPEIINGQILAIWIMDDGYKRNDCNALRLNTQSFSYEEHKLIQKALQSISIESTIQRHKNGFVIYIPSRSMNKIRETVNPYIIPEMKYKIA